MITDILLFPQLSSWSENFSSQEKKARKKTRLEKGKVALKKGVETSRMWKIVITTRVAKSSKVELFDQLEGSKKANFQTNFGDFSVCKMQIKTSTFYSQWLIGSQPLENINSPNNIVLSLSQGQKRLKRENKLFLKRGTPKMSYFFTENSSFHAIMATISKLSSHKFYHFRFLL